MWGRAIVIGILIGLIFIAISLSAQPNVEQTDQIMNKLDQVLQNQQEMFNYLRFIKNKC